MGDLDDVSRDGPIWFRYLVIAALLSGAGGGIASLGKDTSDRYKGSDAKADFEVRDRQLEALQKLMYEHLQHSSRYTDRIERYGQRIEHLETELEQHLRRNNDPR